jgi:hypothetical protein
MSAAMIQEELQQLSKTPRDLRKFGLTVGGVFALLGAFFLWRQKPLWPWFLVPGASLMFFGLVAPRALKGVFVGWMALAFTMGLVVSTLVLMICYFGIITPLALIGRLAGKDFLSEKLNPDAKSYWLPRDRSIARQPSDYERQF